MATKVFFYMKTKIVEYKGENYNLIEDNFPKVQCTSLQEQSEQIIKLQKKVLKYCSYITYLRENIDRNKRKIEKKNKQIKTLKTTLEAIKPENKKNIALFFLISTACIAAFIGFAILGVASNSQFIVFMSKNPISNPYFIKSGLLCGLGNGLLLTGCSFFGSLSILSIRRFIELIKNDKRIKKEIEDTNRKIIKREYDLKSLKGKINDFILGNDFKWHNSMGIQKSPIQGIRQLQDKIITLQRRNENITIEKIDLYLETRRQDMPYIIP